MRSIHKFVVCGFVQVNIWAFLRLKTDFQLCRPPTVGCKGLDVGKSWIQSLCLPDVIPFCLLIIKKTNLDLNSSFSENMPFYAFFKDHWRALASFFDSRTHFKNVLESYAKDARCFA